MTNLTPLLKELKEKADLHIGYGADIMGVKPQTILFLISAIEEMKEALYKLSDKGIATISNFNDGETIVMEYKTTCPAKEVLEKYFGSEK